MGDSFSLFRGLYIDLTWDVTINNEKRLSIHKIVCFTFGSTKGIDKVESIDHTNRDGNDARDCNCRPANSFLQNDNRGEVFK